MHEKFLELGLESPFDDEWFERPSQDDRITTAIDLDGFNEVRRDALLAHATQIDPTSPFWFGLPREEQAARSTRTTTTSSPAASSTPTVPEDDLFAGVTSAGRAVLRRRSTVADGAGVRRRGLGGAAWPRPTATCPPGRGRRPCVEHTATGGARRRGQLLDRRSRTAGWSTPAPGTTPTRPSR